MTMKISERGVDLIKEFEDCKLTAYPDPKTGGAPWTIGWGATGPNIGPGVVWSQAQADTRLFMDIAEREAAVDAAVNVPLTQGQFDAMVSIVFNVGAGSKYRDGIIRLKDGRPSTLLRKLNADDYQGASEAFDSWVSPGSNVERGLRRRRTAERAVFES
ncbi:lysozyme [Variovorax sp. J22R193]|uniref:lysozyme n=1 Tax=Variovorax fucosicus TaxID=3053517 RepID=UPI002575EBC0|nr:lysozyme [Variovorax sp. J22R193]MDM0041891.1 lysozyme [Variovorax sp. J22R193]